MGAADTAAIRAGILRKFVSSCGGSSTETTAGRALARRTRFEVDESAQSPMVSVPRPTIESSGHEGHDQSATTVEWQAATTSE